ncbi:VanZ family protein [Geobacter sulfurreducens]|uniref:VanZ family protein n=1 Tax=Geobacter sulfurreducens TaxID=35554 RepID=UPI0001D8F14C|nr:VanZ family protein [Geobacter sulfurreducens]ADI84675.1 membrane protein, putative [Geobacter sulfurreducens KN400]HML78137.1 VanZ family protein [Geobacter sulfurreducens]
MLTPGSRRKLYTVLLAVWGVAILVLTLMPASKAEPLPFPGWDKIEHAVAFGALAWFAGRFLVVYGKCVRRCWLWAFCATVTYGALIEVAQATLTTTRTAELGDLAADAVGAGLVCLLASRTGDAGNREG